MTFSQSSTWKEVPNLVGFQQRDALRDTVQATGLQGHGARLQLSFFEPTAYGPICDPGNFIITLGGLQCIQRHP